MINLKKKDFPVLFICIGVILLFSFLSLIFYNVDKTFIYDIFVNWRNPGKPTEEINESTFVSTPNKKASKKIEIIGIDNFSLEKIGRFPWSRDTYVNIFNFFINPEGKSYPESILFDIAFLEKEKDDKENDILLANSIKKNGNVILEYYLDFEKGFEKSGEQKEVVDYIEKEFTIDLKKAKIKGRKIDEKIIKNRNFGITFNDITPLLKEYALTGSYAGTVGLFPDSDKKYRRLPLVYIYKNRIHFHAIIFMLCHYYGININDIEVDFGRYIKLNNITKNSNNKKEIIIPIDLHGNLFIDFIGNSSQIWPIRSAYDIYSNRAPAEYFKDKLVFFGIYSLGAAKDIWLTPSGLMFGVEFLAVATNQIINQKFFKFFNWFFIFLVIVLVSAFLSFYFYKLPIIKTYILAILFLFFYTLFAYIAFIYYLIVPYSGIIIQVLTLLISIIVYRILTEEKEKRFIRATFSNFVSKVVVDELLKHPEKIKLGGENKEITVLFSDIRGFTSRSEQMKPEEVVDLLNKYLSRMTEIIFKFHGTLDKYIGDAIMAFWGAPIPQEDHALLACCTALEMTKELEKLNNELPEDLNLDIGIGINTGYAIVGNMGSSSRMDYTLIGDTVNTGSRLEGVNKFYKTRIIISEYTYEKVKDFFYIRLIDKITAKGKTIPIKIYEILDYKEDFDPFKIVDKYNKIGNKLKSE
ncbi:MAG: adenylate/guanylate cyclase domain-containing protein [Spirochaetes bacterium]|nr:adenylate/guanylate cyclase domain-containing protein [Spirochaetota bacterium]